MDELMEKILKLQSEYFKRKQLLFILDIISIFAIFYAIFIIFHIEFFLKKLPFDLPIPINIISPIIALIIAMIGASLLHRNDHNINFNLLVEKSYPEMNEKLRTAYDNISEKNVIVESLKSLVLSGLTIVSASTLLSAGTIITKTIIVLVFVSGTATISSNPEKYSIPLEDIESAYTNISNTITGNETTGPIDAVGQPEMFDKVGEEGGGDIFSKPKIASIEGKNIDLTLYSGMGTGFEVRDASETLNQFIQSDLNLFPVNIEGSNVSDGGYSILMTKTETEKELINKYAIERSKI